MPGRADIGALYSTHNRMGGRGKGEGGSEGEGERVIGAERSSSRSVLKDRGGIRSQERKETRRPFLGFEPRGVVGQEGLEPFKNAILFSHVRFWR